MTVWTMCCFCRHIQLHRAAVGPFWAGWMSLAGFSKEKLPATQPQIQPKSQVFHLSCKFHVLAAQVFSSDCLCCIEVNRFIPKKKKKDDLISPQHRYDTSSSFFNKRRQTARHRDETSIKGRNCNLLTRCYFYRDAARRREPSEPNPTTSAHMHSTCVFRPLTFAAMLCVCVRQRGRRVAAAGEGRRWSRWTRGRSVKEDYGTSKPSSRS